jgi:hypothetical protein
MKKEILFTFVQGCNAWDVLSVQYPKKNAQLGELDEEKGEIHLSSILFKPIDFFVLSILLIAFPSYRRIRIPFLSKDFSFVETVSKIRLFTDKK